MAKPSKDPLRDPHEFVKAADREYVRSKSWECSQSPTGAHYWVYDSPGTAGSKTCRHCGVTTDAEQGRLPVWSHPIILSRMHQQRLATEGYPIHYKYPV